LNEVLDISRYKPWALSWGRPRRARERMDRVWSLRYNAVVPSNSERLSGASLQDIRGEEKVEKVSLEQMKRKYAGHKRNTIPGLKHLIRRRGK